MNSEVSYQDRVRRGTLPLAQYWLKELSGIRYMKREGTGDI